MYKHILRPLYKVYRVKFCLYVLKVTHSQQEKSEWFISTVDQCDCELESQSGGVIAMRYKKRILEMLSVINS